LPVLLHDEDKDAWGRPKQRTTLMLLDEFPSLGQIDAFANHMKLMASFKVKGMLVVQSVNDIIGTYGQNNTIIDNSHLVVAFATADVTSLDRISKMTGTVREYRESYSRPDRVFTAGRRTINESETVQPLMTPGDVRELPYDEQLILINGTKPIRTKKFVYYEHHQLKQYVKPPPNQAERIDAPPGWRSEWENDRVKGDRKFHPLAAKLREELNRSDSGPQGEAEADDDADWSAKPNVAPVPSTHSTVPNTAVPKPSVAIQPFTPPRAVDVAADPLTEQRDAHPAAQTFEGGF
jgi:type IV secretory pathway TraG/TraD family ATPase VirD4